MCLIAAADPPPSASWLATSQPCSAAARSRRSSRGGKLKGLAVSGQRRSRLLPDLPPIADVYPGYEVTIWQGLFAPVGTPPAIVARLREEVNAILAQPDVMDKLAGSGDPYVTTPADFVARIRSDHARYGKLIKDIGLAVD